MIRPTTRLFRPLSGALLCALSWNISACSTPPMPIDATSDQGPMDGLSADGSQDDAAAESSVDARPEPEGCDPLDPGHCVFPFPSNLYLREDATRETGFTLQFGPRSLPRTNAGNFVDPAAWQRLDGYGLGVAAMTHVPNLDPAGLPTEYDIEPSMAADARIVYFQVVQAAGTTTLRRVPYFAELDSQEPNAAEKSLFIRPALVLEPNTRYIIALRNLRRRDGSAVTASPAFASLRDRTAMSNPELAPRVTRFERMFAELTAAGIDRGTLSLAWDFNTGSSRAIHGPLLHMTRDAIRQHPMGPEFRNVQVTEFTVAQNADIAVEIRAQLETPHYMQERVIRGHSWFVLRNGPDGMPQSEGTRTVDLWIRIPRSAVRSATNPNPMPHGLVQYGHGLMGSGDEVRAGYNGTLANENRLIFFSASLAGMSFEDFITVGQVLRDFTRFPFISDRLHQGLTDWVLLTRSMISRFAALPEVTSRGIVIAPDERFYSGISQGGIFGGTFLAISPDITRGHLGVPGNNYSTLLHRSVDFNGYFTVLRGAYANVRDQSVLLGLSQLLWDQTDPISYARHITAQPFTGLPTHYALLAPAKGDHQVAPTTNEVLARSDIGIALMTPYDGPTMPRTVTRVLEGTYPRRGSGVVLWDLGNPWQIAGNRTSSAEQLMLSDPHGRVRQMHTWHSRQMVHFFRGRPQTEAPEIMDVCNGQACAFTNCFGAASMCTPRF
ncbi:MAG: hypothetical protein Q8Q09_20695 [Deltaproteobacteria bacterium]|nr:hypothetical protein [Deltaproteobacteria bacterium]